MFWKASKVGKFSLIILAVIGLMVISLVEFSLHRVKQRWFDEKLAAAELTGQAHETIKNAAFEKKIVVDNISDPNETGLIGEQFTLITTDQGDLDAKLTTTNPNWAGIIVHLLKRALVRKGDYVAVSWTGSMPALNIAVLAAIETIGARPVIISSVGASMWGANNPDFAWLDMESLLYNRGIFHYKSVAASIGGRGDRGGNLSPKGRKQCRQIVERNGVPLIEEDILDKAVKKRYENFMKHIPRGKNFAAYINVGGGLASIGSAHNLEIIKPGLIRYLPKYNYPIRGTMILFGEKGMPIIDLTSIKKLSTRYGLPISPEPLPDPPSGGIFYRPHYRTELVGALLVLYAIATFVIIRIDLLSYLRRRKKRSAIEKS